MSEVSHNTQQLLDMAEQLEDMDIDEKVTDRVRELEITNACWPAFSEWTGATANYEQLRKAAEDASTGLATVVTAIGGTVTSVANYYQRMEDRHGQDFDSVDMDEVDA